MAALERLKLLEWLEPWTFGTPSLRLRFERSEAVKRLERFERAAVLIILHPFAFILI